MHADLGVHKREEEQPCSQAVMEQSGEIGNVVKVGHYQCAAEKQFGSAYTNKCTLRQLIALDRITASPLTKRHSNQEEKPNRADPRGEPES